jgi:hypothetical protein
MTPGTATATITGPMQLVRAAKKRVVDALKAEGLHVREEKAADSLTLHVSFRTGVPFPAFADASANYPAVTLHLKWQAKSGTATPVGGEVTLKDGKPITA